MMTGKKDPLYQIIMMTIKEIQIKNRWRQCEILAEKDTIDFIKAIKEDNENVEDTEHKIMNRMKEKSTETETNRVRL